MDIWLWDEYSGTENPLSLISLSLSLSLWVPAVGEQRAEAGASAGPEGTEGQSDPGRPAGAFLQHIATFLHHQHGPGKWVALTLCKHTSLCVSTCLVFTVSVIVCPC